MMIPPIHDSDAGQDKLRCGVLPGSLEICDQFQQVLHVVIHHAKRDVARLANPTSEVPSLMAVVPHNLSVGLAADIASVRLRPTGRFLLASLTMLAPLLSLSKRIKRVPLPTLFSLTGLYLGPSAIRLQFRGYLLLVLNSIAAISGVLFCWVLSFIDGPTLFLMGGAICVIVFTQPFFVPSAIGAGYSSDPILVLGKVAPPGFWVFKWHQPRSFCERVGVRGGRGARHTAVVPTLA
jgi:hypothetical protein